jgi:hypothetical protein
MVKTIGINKEYLENKLTSLTEQREKVLKILDQYSKLFDKLEGAIEITNSMLQEIEPKDEVQPDVKEEKPKK